MNRYIILILLAGFVWSCGDSKKGKSDISSQLEFIKEKYAPDKRTAIWDVAFKSAAGGELILEGETQFTEAKEELFYMLDTANIAFIDSIRLVPASDLNGMHFGVVRLPVANIRSNPKHSAEMSTQATLGTPLKVIKKLEDWYYVQTPDKYLGYIDAAGFTPMKIEQYEAWMEREKVIVTKDFSTVHKGIDKNSQLVSKVLQGNILALEGGLLGVYQEVRFPDGRNGYININDVTTLRSWFAALPSTENAIVETAFQFMGTPYLWGGTSPNGFDCSGFTKTVYYLNGKLLPRDASQQVHVGLDLGATIDTTNWKRGDLLFFGKKATETDDEKVTHVAIYIGNGRMIHSAGYVKVNSLIRTYSDFAPDRYDTFLRAKRMLGVAGDNGVYALETLPEYMVE